MVINADAFANAKDLLESRGKKKRRCASLLRGIILLLRVSFMFVMA